jgi:hypothetical protein
MTESIEHIYFRGLLGVSYPDFLTELAIVVLNTPSPFSHMNIYKLCKPQEPEIILAEIEHLIVVTQSYTLFIVTNIATLILQKYHPYKYCNMAHLSEIASGHCSDPVTTAVDSESQ